MEDSANPLNKQPTLLHSAQEDIYIALSNLIFTPGNVPDYASMGFKAASLVPDLQAKFNAGQKAAQDAQTHAAQQQLAALKLQQEQQKAALFAAIAPELQAYKLAELQKMTQQLNGMAVPTGYAPGLPGGSAPTAFRQPVQRGPQVSSTQGQGTPNDEIPYNAPGSQPASVVPMDFGQGALQPTPPQWRFISPDSPQYAPTVDASNYSNGDLSGYGFDDTGEYPA